MSENSSKELPFELWAEILTKYLPIYTLHHCQLVCKKWNQLTKPRLYYTTTIDKENTDPTKLVFGYQDPRNRELLSPNRYFVKQVFYRYFDSPTTNQMRTDNVYLKELFPELIHVYTDPEADNRVYRNICRCLRYETGQNTMYTENDANRFDEVKEEYDYTILGCGLEVLPCPDSINVSYSLNYTNFYSEFIYKHRNTLQNMALYKNVHFNTLGLGRYMQKFPELRALKVFDGVFRHVRELAPIFRACSLIDTVFIFGFYHETLDEVKQIKQLQRADKVKRLFWKSDGIKLDSFHAIHEMFWNIKQLKLVTAGRWITNWTQEQLEGAKAVMTQSHILNDFEMYVADQLSFVLIPLVDKNALNKAKLLLSEFYNCSLPLKQQTPFKKTHNTFVVRFLDQENDENEPPSDITQCTVGFEFKAHNSLYRNERTLTFNHFLLEQTLFRNREKLHLLYMEGSREKIHQLVLDYRFFFSSYGLSRIWPQSLYQDTVNFFPNLKKLQLRVSDNSIPHLPRMVINKPHDELTPEELESIKLHPNIEYVQVMGKIECDVYVYMSVWFPNLKVLSLSSLFPPLTYDRTREDDRHTYNCQLQPNLVNMQYTALECLKLDWNTIRHAVKRAHFYLTIFRYNDPDHSFCIFINNGFKDCRQAEKEEADLQEYRYQNVKLLFKNVKRLELYDTFYTGDKHDMVNEISYIGWDASKGDEYSFLCEDLDIENRVKHNNLVKTFDIV